MYLTKILRGIILITLLIQMQLKGKGVFQGERRWDRQRESGT